MTAPDAAPEVVVLPWLQLRKPLIVGNVEFLPFDEALNRAGKRQGALKTLTACFYSQYVQADLEEFHRSGTFKADRLEPIQPVVVFVDDRITKDRVTIATQVLSFAAIAANAGSKVTYVNSTVFTSFVQRLGDAGFIGRRTRRMHGTALAGAPAALVIDVRPAWCGTFASPDIELMDALCKVVYRPVAAGLRRCLRSLFGATSDADLIFPDLERSLYALASENLLYRKGSPNSFRAQLLRGETLLRPHISHRQAVRIPRRGSRIMSAWKVIREDRNSFWHPENRRRGRFAFERQNNVHPNLIAFQVLRALVVASLAEWGVIAKESKLLLVLPAVEKWLRDLGPHDNRESEEASNLGPYLAKQSLILATRRAVDALRAAGGFAAIARRMPQ